MKIVLLAPSNVEGNYTASLLVRGFRAVTIPAVAPALDFPKLMQEYLKHDGCLEPPRVCRRLFGLSYAAIMCVCSSPA